MLNGLILMVLLAGGAGLMWLVSKVFPGKDRPSHFVAIGVVIVGLIATLVVLSDESSSSSIDHEFEDDFSWARGR